MTFDCRCLLSWSSIATMHLLSRMRYEKRMYTRQGIRAPSGSEPEINVAVIDAQGDLRVWQRSQSGASSNTITGRNLLKDF